MSEASRVPAQHRPEHRSERRRTTPTEGAPKAAEHPKPAPAAVQPAVSGKLPLAYVVRQLVADKWLSQ